MVCAMEAIGPSVTTLLELVSSLGREAGEAAFVERHASVFIKHPIGGDAAVSPADATLGFATERIDLGAIAALGALAPKWLVVPLRKKEGHAFQDRLSVGRATNCDVVLRFSFVSKLQGHIMLEAGQPTSYVDYGGANPGRLNGAPLTPKVRTPLSSGDRLSVGPLALELCGQERFVQIVRSLSERPVG